MRLRRSSRSSSRSYAPLLALLVATAAVAAGVATPSARAGGDAADAREEAVAIEDPELPLAERTRPWIPMRIRDLTLPGGIVMGFLPTTAAPLGRGQWAFELHYSRTNNFIASDRVELFLEERGLLRTELSDQDVLDILALPGDNYLLDGEFGLTQLVAHFGVSKNGTLSLTVPRIGYAGGFLDSTIEGFHDTFGFSQAGAEYLPRDRFQVIFDFDESPGAPLVLRDRPTRAGMGDPMLVYKHSLPPFGSGWRPAVQIGAKLAVADEEKFLSSGNDDWGVQLTLEKGWRKYGLVLNASWVDLGDFEAGLDGSNVAALHISWMRYYGRRTLGVLQFFSGDNLFGDVTTTDFGEIEFQISAGFKVFFRRSFVGFGLTENLFNFDNTPDIGVHLMTGFFLTGRGRR